MSGFSAAWLALREPADVAARSEAVTAFVLRGLGAGGEVAIADLGCGTGANLRFLSPRVPASSRWRLIDHDQALLDRARQSAGPDADVRIADLRALDPTLLAGCRLVTASALLDLVSDAWLAGLIRACRGQSSIVLAALNYDGRIVCTPADEDDPFAVGLVNRHQRTDKGFGPALGPEAGARAEALLSSAGYDVCRAASDWALDARHLALQRELIAGWAAAAREMQPDAAGRLGEWERRRLAWVESGASQIVVGHDDVGGVPR